MDIKINKEKNNTYKIDVSVESAKVDNAFDIALNHEAKNAEIKGFRKGKAPKNIVKENIDQSKLRSHALNHLLEKIVPDIIKENKLTPIVYPRFEIQEFEEGKDLKMVVTVIEKPEIKLGDYKKSIKNSVDKQKSNKETKDLPINSDQVIDAVLIGAEVGVANELIEEETNRMISSFIEQVEKMGVNIEQYLQSVNKKAEDIRDEYTKMAEKNIKADFILNEIASKEAIEVSDIEVDQTIAGIPDEKSREALSNPSQRIYIKAVILKNKTIQKLVEEALPKDSTKSKKAGEFDASKSDKK